MRPSLANLRRDTETPVGREAGSTTEKNNPKRARKERRTPIRVNGEWVRHYRHAPLDNASIRRAVHALKDPSQVAAVAAEHGPIAEWDVSEVENFSRLFAHSTDSITDLSGWEVGNATNMNGMFFDAHRFTSDLSEWDVRNVKNMRFMFTSARRFTSDLSKWDVGNVENMSSMFYGATSFTSDLSRWNVRNVKHTCSMFYSATSFTSDLSRWNVGNFVMMLSMFNGAASFTSDLSMWDVGKVKNMLDTFEGAVSFGPPLNRGADGGWTPESLAQHQAFVESSTVLRSYKARRRWREVRELWYVARPVVLALLRWAEERSIAEKRHETADTMTMQELLYDIKKLNDHRGD